MAQLVLKDIGKLFGGVTSVEPLKKVNLTIEPGDFIAISGHSGIGKSTLLYLMGGLIQPTSGELVYNERNVESYNDREMDYYRANVMSFVFQEFCFVQALNLKDNLMLAASQNATLSSVALEKLLDEYLKRLNLYERKFFMPSQLSGGQKRRAMLIAGVLKNSEFILADEPANDLDEKMVIEIMNILIEEKNKGRGIVLVSHSEEIINHADVLYVLEDGALVKQTRRQ